MVGQGVIDFLSARVFWVCGEMATRQLEPTDVPAQYTVVKSPGFLQTPTCTITSKKDDSVQMRAVEFHGKKDMKVCLRSKPMVTDPVRLTFNTEISGMFQSMLGKLL